MSKPPYILKVNRLWGRVRGFAFYPFIVTLTPEDKKHIAQLDTMLLKYLLIFLPMQVFAGPYIALGLGVPLAPDSGYLPDNYGIAGIGYVHHVDEVASIDMGFMHRSLTSRGTQNKCGSTEIDCIGDNAIEVKLRFEWD